MKYNLKEFKFKEMGVCMDGGSKIIDVINPNKQGLTICLMQHISIDYYEEISKIPGRIYLDDYLVEKRSQTEKEVIDLLRTKIINDLRLNSSNDIIDKILWIESEDYEHLSPNKLKLSEARKRFLQDELKNAKT
jgi:hypothetical protein